MRTRALVTYLVLVVVVMLSPGRAGAQSASGSIAGVVKDATGAILPGVAVEAASPALIEKVRAVVTDDRGQYKVVDLRPGTYTVTFSLPGFSTIKREGLELTTGFTATVNAELKVGSLSETVTVSGASPIVDIQNVRTQNVLSRDSLDKLPTGKTSQAFGALTLGAVVVNGGQDVGGNKAETSSSIAVHGGRNVDQRVTVDGMSNNIGQGPGGGFARMYKNNQLTTQEITLETSGIAAESETAGVQINYVPKDGGNAFRGSSLLEYSGPSLQSTNLTDELRARGLTSTSSVKKIYDAGAGFGGPIKRDTLWFYFAHRWWGAQESVPGNYFNKTPHTLFYTPDLTRQAYLDIYSRDDTGRVTWQISKKQKLSFSEGFQDSCHCYYMAENNVAPEATTDQKYYPLSLAQVSWSYPATNRLLLQAGVTYGVNGLPSGGSDTSTINDIPITELSTGYRYGANGSFSDPTGPMGQTYYNQSNGRIALSYITGSHALKAGFMFFRGTSNVSTRRNALPVSYSFRKASPDAAPTPVSITYFASPSWNLSLANKPGVYAQDQWTIRRLTLNVGLRYDGLRAWSPPQSRPGGIFVPAVQVTRTIDNVPNWKDISPRVGVAYDVFGNGKTAIKGSVGRYVQGELVSIATATNPMNAIVTSATRTWNDANRDYVPQDAELGPLSNSAFGTVVVNTRYADDVLTGWGVRPNNMTASATLQHQLQAGVGVAATYYYRSYGNFRVTDNLRVTPADYDTYCITAPKDARLPGGGGNRFCGLYDIKPSAFGQVDNLVSRASKFGHQSERYDGFDASVNARFGHGGHLSGGMATGRTVTDTCFVVDSPQQARPEFCHATNPFAGQTQFKFNAVYPLKWDVQLSGVFQNLAGVPVSGVPINQGQVFGDPLAGGSYVATNAEIAPSLGRNLGACGVAATCGATVAVDLVPPYSAREDRLTQVDIRLMKVFHVGGRSIQGNFDAYNIFNGNTVLAVNTRFGPTYLLPTSILAGRLFKFGLQLEF